MDLTDTRYEVENGLAWITIDRPDRMNAFRARTVDELIHLFTRAWASPEVGVICLTGAGDRAFCAGGDQKQRAETGDYGPSESGLFEIERLHRLIREVPKPVIAAVNGVAIGGGHVLHVAVRRDDRGRGRARSARSGRASARSTAASGPRTWRASSGRSAPARSGSAAGATTLPPPSGGAWSTRSCRSIGCATRFACGPTTCSRCPRPRCGSSSSRSTPTPSTSPGSRRLSFSGLGLFFGTEEAGEGVRAFAENRAPDYSGYRERASS